jgi:hypothetical protein
MNAQLLSSLKFKWQFSLTIMTIIAVGLHFIIKYNLYLFNPINIYSILIANIPLLLTPTRDKHSYN